MAAPPLSIGFLLGAGVSTPISPSTTALTDIVRKRLNDYFMHTDEQWYLRANTPGPLPNQLARQERVGQIIPFLAALVDRYYTNRVDPVGCPVRPCNYEDIAYLAESLTNTLTRERDDPGLLPLVDEATRALGWSTEMLAQAAADAVSFIQSVVFMELVDRHPSPEHVRLFVDAAKDPDVRSLQLYSLIHDCLIEEQFAAADVSFFDFLAAQTDGRLLLDLTAPIPAKVRATLYKAHGSVRWRRFRPIDAAQAVDPSFAEWIGSDRDAAGKRHDDGNKWRSLGMPLVLVGRFNKELEYHNIPFSRLFDRITQSLEEQRQLVVAGYGFGDKGINTTLINWVYGRRAGERRLVVMHRDKDQLLASARGAIRNRWDDWAQQGILRWVPHFPSDTTWAEVKTILPE